MGSVGTHPFASMSSKTRVMLCAIWRSKLPPNGSVPPIDRGPAARWGVKVPRPNGPRVPAQPSITLCTVATIGSFSPTPSSVRIGISVGPKASKSSCDSQMSNTWIPPFDSSA